MKHTITKRKSWKATLAAADKPVQLPVAHDALTARLIELAGFDAYQVGGYALSLSTAQFVGLAMIALGAIAVARTRAVSALAVG